MKKTAAVAALSVIGLVILGGTSLAQSPPQYTVVDLGTLGGDFVYAQGINNSGQVTGSSSLAGGFNPYYAFLYSNGSMQDLGTLGGQSFGYGINNSGQVAGTYFVAGTDNQYRAFLYSNGSMQDLGTLGGLKSGAAGINNFGQVTG